MVSLLTTSFHSLNSPLWSVLPLKFSMWVSCSRPTNSGVTSICGQGCQMAKFDPFLSLDCAGVEGVGAQSKGKEGIKFCNVA